MQRLPRRTQRHHQHRNPHHQRPSLRRSQHHPPLRHHLRHQHQNLRRLRLSQHRHQRLLLLPPNRHLSRSADQNVSQPPKHRHLNRRKLQYRRNHQRLRKRRCRNSRQTHNRAASRVMISPSSAHARTVKNLLHVPPLKSRLLCQHRHLHQMLRHLRRTLLHLHPPRHQPQTRRQPLTHRHHHRTVLQVARPQPVKPCRIRSLLRRKKLLP